MKDAWASDDAAKQRAKALARWEGEGGALNASADQTLDESEMRILRHLGAALVSEWSNLPPACQKAIFTRASALHPADGARIKLELARFLHDHKNGNRRTPTVHLRTGKETRHD